MKICTAPKLTVAALTAIGALAVMTPTPVKAQLLTGWWFVGPNGNDSTCNFQATQSTVLLPGTIPCKTLTKACDSVTAPTERILFLPNPVPYVENAVCGASGTSTIKLYILGQGPVTYMHGVIGAHKPTIEFTGDYVDFGKIEFVGNDGDAVYIHGTAAHPSEDFEFFYNTTVSSNAGYGIHAKWTNNLVIKQDLISNNLKDCIFIEQSSNAKVYGNSIYRCGSVSGIPPVAVRKPAAHFLNTPNSEFEDNNLKESAVLPTLVLENSPFFNADNNHQNDPLYPPFSYTVTPSSDLATDTFTNN